MASLTINATFNATWSGAISGATAVVNQVLLDIGALLQPTANVNYTFSIEFGWGVDPDSGTVVTGETAHSSWSLDGFGDPYSTWLTAMQALTPTNSIQATAWANLPGSSPFGANQLLTTTPMMVAIGRSAPSNFKRGSVGIGSGSAWDVTPDGSTCAGPDVSMYGVVWHEVTEIMGRAANCGGNTTVYFGDWYTYSALNTRNITTSSIRYLSADNGQSVIAFLNQNTAGGFDPGDTADSSGYKVAFDAFAGNNFGCVTPFGTVPVPAGTNTGASVTVAQGVALCLQYMTIIGWRLTPNGLINAGIGGSVVGTSRGISTVNGLSSSIFNAVGTSSGTSSVNGLAPNPITAIGSSAGVSTVNGFSPPIITYGRPLRMRG
jgi:hypothetical protein